MPLPRIAIAFIRRQSWSPPLQDHFERGADFLLVPVKIHAYAYAIAHTANAKSPRRYCMEWGFIKITHALVNLGKMPNLNTRF
ncbi:hypothetical protein [Scytonema sp. PCC 10023]|uniref:hypothetical protein n=1 Tax=Scytonema sp. PCC 10023 TaxID=1680591 RepID=UPI0039C60712